MKCVRDGEQLGLNPTMLKLVTELADLPGTSRNYGIFRAVTGSHRDPIGIGGAMAWLTASRGAKTTAIRPSRGSCCINRPRCATSCNPSSRVKTPAKQAAAYSPMLCPRSNSGSIPQDCHSLASAYSKANSAGWVWMVSSRAPAALIRVQQLQQRPLEDVAQDLVAFDQGLAKRPWESGIIPVPFPRIAIPGR